MGTPISFNSGTTASYTAGIFKKATVGLNLKTGLVAGNNWWNGVDVSATQYLIYSDIYSQGQSTFAGSRPTAWSTPDLSDASLILLINTLPDRVGLPGFTTVSQAVNWLNQTGKYFLIKTGYENIVTAGLVANYDFGWYNSYPGSGSSFYDISGNYVTGTLYNGPGFSGNDNGYLNFDGTDDYAQVTQTLTTPITICGWVRYNSQSQLYNTWIDISPHQVLAISINREGDGYTKIYIGNGSSWIGAPGISSTLKMQPNTWYHLAFVSNGSGSVLYINGVNAGTSIYSPSGYGTFYRLGTLSFGSGYEMFNGSIATFSIYNTALTQSQILQNFNAQAYRFGINNNVVTSGLILNLNAENQISYPGSGTAWYDLSGNNNTTTLFNGPTYNSNGYITFDGTDDYGYNSTPSGFDLNSTNAISAEALINYSPSDYDFWWTANNSGIKYRFGTNSSGYFFWDMGQHVDRNYSGYVLPSNTWNHVVFTGGIENGSIVTRIYSNGSLITTNNEGITTLPTIAEFYVGTGESITSHNFNGSISTIKVYNRVLSPTEIKQNYYQGNIVTDNLQLLLDAGNLVSYPATGTVWYDISGNGNNGTLTNGPTFSASNGGVLTFDGTNDYSISTSPGSYSEYTFMFFCKWITSVASNRILGLTSFGTFTIFTPENVGFHYNPINYDPPSVVLSSGVNVGFGNWCQIAVTVSQSKSLVTIYIDGIARNTTSQIPAGNWEGNLILGAQYTSALYSNCQISNFMLYNKELNPIEIQNNFNAYKSRYGL